MKHKDAIHPLQSFKRILIKISGETLAGSGADAVDMSVLRSLTQQIAALSEVWEIALVVGGGNFFRGAALADTSFSRGIGDYVGMLGTVMNGLMFQDLLMQQGIMTHVFSGVSVEGVTESFSQAHKEQYFGHRQVVIFTGGIGQPYFTTDTAAVVWALRSGCQAVLKGTKVDGVYSADPVTNPEALFFHTLTHHEALQKKLRVMDLTALALANESHLPLAVFNIQRPQGLSAVLEGRPPFTWIE